MRQVRFGRVASGSGSATVTFGVALPAGQTPYIIGNVLASSTNQVFSVHFSNITNTGFTYTKTFVYTTSGTGGLATGEAFDWWAWTT